MLRPRSSAPFLPGHNQVGWWVDCCAVLRTFGKVHPDRTLARAPNLQCIGCWPTPRPYNRSVPLVWLIVPGHALYPPHHSRPRSEDVAARPAKQQYKLHSEYSERPSDKCVAEKSARVCCVRVWETTRERADYSPVVTSARDGTACVVIARDIVRATIPIRVVWH